MLSILPSSKMEQYASKWYTYFTTEKHGKNTLFNSQLIKRIIFNNFLTLNLLSSQNTPSFLKHFFHAHSLNDYSVASVPSVVKLLDQRNL